MLASPTASTLPISRPQPDIFFVTHANCEPWVSNPRTNADRLDDEMRELIAAISANGVRQSLTVRPHPERPNAYQIAAGARRWHALGHAIRAGARPADDPLPIRVEQLSAFEMVVVALEENLQRKAMTPLEEAEAYASLADGAQPGDRVTASIAKRVGKTQRHVQVYIRLANHLSPRAKQALREEHINLGHAKVLTGVPAEEQDRFLAERIRRRPLGLEPADLRAELAGHGSPPADASPGQTVEEDRVTPARAARPTQRLTMTLRARSLLRAFAKQPGLAMRLAALRFLESLRHRPAREALRSNWRATLRACPTTGALWQALLEQRDSAVHALIAEVVALEMVDGDTMDGPPALLGQLTTTLGLDRVEDFELTEEWLDAYRRRDQLLDLGLACGAIQAADLASLNGLSLPDLRQVILTSESRDPAWLPPELYFTAGTVAESAEATNTTGD